MIGKPLLLELLFLTDCRISRAMWVTSRLAPPTILVNWPVTRFATGGTPMASYLIIQQTRFCSYRGNQAVPRVSTNLHFVT